MNDNLYISGVINTKLNNLLKENDYDYLKKLNNEEIINYLNNICFIETFEIKDFKTLVNIYYDNLYKELLDYTNNRYYVDIFYINKLISIIKIKNYKKNLIYKDINIYYQNFMKYQKQDNFTNELYLYLDNKINNKDISNYLDIIKIIINIKTYYRINKFNLNKDIFKKELLSCSYNFNFDNFKDILKTKNEELFLILNNNFDDINKFNSKLDSYLDNYMFKKYEFSNDFISLYLKYGYLKIKEIKKIEKIFYGV